MKDIEPQNILIVRLSSMGDIVLTTPLVRAVRRRFPKARIDFIVKREFAELMQTNPHITTVYAYDKCSGTRGLLTLARQLRQNRYNLLVDIHKNFRSYLLRFLTQPDQVTAYSKQIVQRTLLVKLGINRYGKILQIPERYLKSMKPFGVVGDEKGLELFPTETHRSKVKSIFQRENLSEEDLAIGFGPIASFSLKQWPAEKFIELGQQLVQNFGARILLFGGSEETRMIEQIASQIPNAPVVLCGRLSFLESAVAVQRCALFVGNDTGMLHIATAMERKVIALFGPTVEEFGYYPYRAQSVVVSKPLSCRPCTHTGKGMCKISTHACMKDIQVAEVFDAVEMLLDNE